MMTEDVKRPQRKGRRGYAALLSALFVMAVLVVGAPVTHAAADTTYSPNWTSNLGGWSVTGTCVWVSTNNVGCDASGTGTLESPSQLAPNGTTSINVSAGGVHVSAGTGTVTLYAVYGGSSHDLSPVCNLTATPVTCTASIAVTAGQQVSYGIKTTSNENLTVTSYTATYVGSAGATAGGGSTGSVSFPTLDLASISANMGGFFNFLAPALWVVAGISLGGLIVGKARHLF